MIYSLSNANLKPTLTWKLGNIKSSIYRETEAFKLEKGFWALCLNYFPHVEETLNISIKMSKDPELADKKKEEVKQKAKVKPPAIVSGYPSGTIVSMITSLKIKNEECFKDPKLQSLICSSKASTILKKVPGELLDENRSIEVDIYFKVKFTISSILNYMSKNFKAICTDKRIMQVDKEDLKLLLKYQDLNSENKDDILLAIANWTYYNGNEDSFELLWNIDLKQVSINTLLSVIRDYPNIRDDASFKEKLYDIGLESEEIVSSFIKKFCDDLSFYDNFSPPESEIEMIKRPEIKTSSTRKYMNSVRYK